LRGALTLKSSASVPEGDEGEAALAAAAFFVGRQTRTVQKGNAPAERLARFPAELV